MDSPISILLVEDQITEAMLTEHALKRAGMRCAFERVETAPAFRQGLAKRPDVILSDFTLPTFDGMSALKIAAAEAPDIPFIFVSGTIGEERAIEALKMGATDYVLKTNLSRLAPALRRALSENRARRAARRAEQRFRDLIQTSQDWIWELDVDGAYVYASPGVRDILGADPDAIVGRYLTDRMHDDDAVVLDGAIKSLRGTGERALQFSGRWRHEDGSYRWLERHALVVLDDHGLVCGFRGTDRDVTLRKAHEDKIGRLNRIHVMLSSINTAVLRIRDRKELFAEVCRLAATQGGYPNVGVLLVDPGTATARTVAVAGENAQYFSDFSVRVRPGATQFSSLTEESLCTGVPVTCNDLSDIARNVYGRAQSLRSGMRAISVWPLSVDGTVVGALYLYAAEVGAFDVDETNVLSQVAGSLSFALQYIEKEGEAEYLAYFDRLTGLASRPLFSERLARALASAETAASTETTVWVIDIERLAGINDRYGRHCGDRLLQLFAERLKGIASDPAELGYFGNGCFGIRTEVVPGSGRESPDAREELIKSISEPVTVDGQQIHVTLKIGAARWPVDSAFADGLLHNAELAVKRAKTSSSRFLDYAADMNAHLLRRMTLEQQLRRAIEERQFLLHYQPKISIEAGRMVGVEALLRWDDPESGLRSPLEFIPVLEDSGLIVDVGQWVVEQSVADSIDWASLGLDGTTIAVNVSPLQFRRADFAERFVATIAPLAARGHRVDIELTESALMDNLDSAAESIARLRAGGVRIAIDDFGTGYSSLSRLLRVPVDYLKIDRSFVAKLDSTPANHSIVATIVALARSFGLATIAEGVESRAELAELRRLGCQQFQGYLAAKPMPAERLKALLLETRGAFDMGVDPGAGRATGPPAAG